MVPPSWVLKCFTMIGLGPNVVDLMDSSMCNWKTYLYSCGVHKGAVSI